ncbi:pentatricopeptide repeat-containing protein At2g03880, mitochondrial-like [Neltuma alba]|uniref:pentatricopeptide repeat-containing protein At2g03880, mitochondrial-like n=1 Tax=Neltuma alba TaxID=207710 RepID=UPI0010A59954|nr:pentatricopeptide repeat-containing protein At2g03880, mitochondrial-like [Prosopis alba]XP_028782116.1 pentatricopeptide repeat-containing protein At2g03880, mitochondrial-like [Prosopis alba]XP_028782117.1 pentatricopeptide repeat-containing protein At2g03880, mitochondrial-like [Prosopis alba]XP_028782118.1 pentatricopeptide repeat-containing protein At2g03880, mitochondrial-like [Prosopis alba]
MEYPAVASEMPSLPCLQHPSRVFNNSKYINVTVRVKSLCSVAMGTSNSAFVDRQSLMSQANTENLWAMPGRRVPGLKRTNSESHRDSKEEEPVNVNSKERIKQYSAWLHTCAFKDSLNEGRAVHGHQVRSGVDPDSHFWVSLINMYAKCGCPAYARQVLANMSQQDVVSWTTVINGFVAQGNAREGINLFCEMRREGIRPNEFTLATCLRACCMCANIDFGKQVKAEAIKVGLLSDSFIGSALIDLYAKCGEISLADKMFFCMPEQNEVLWNVLLSRHAQLGHGKEIIRLFGKMLKSEVKFSKYTLSSVLKGCENSGDLRNGQIAHCLAIKSGFELDNFLACNLIDMYSTCLLVGDALRLFSMMEDHDVVSWSTMISCLDQQGHHSEATKLFNLMRRRHVQPNQFTFASVVSASTEMGNLHIGESIHACILKYGFESDISVSNALIRMYMKNGCVHDGARVFEAMAGRDLISWNSLLSGYHDYDYSESGPRTFYQMLVEGFRPNMYSFISVLRSCSSHLDLGFGKQVHAQVFKNNLNGNDYVVTALLDMYAKCGCMEESCVAFNKLVSRNVFTWTVIITGFVQNDLAEKAIDCINLMQREGVKPNEFTLASCISGCSRITATESGRQLHSMVIKSGHLCDMFVSSALVDMYAKCGRIEDAEIIFKGLVGYDTVLWNTMICGFSAHGQGEKALKIFEEMKDNNYLPDEVTFIGVLSACSHIGLVEEGKQYFDCMSSLYGISPTDEHYACMVDILSRAGRFDEVESLVEEMNLTHNALVWETILGACAKHGNIKLGERASEKIFELKPETDSNYILLSNIFAGKEKWTEVKKVRALMSSQGVKKEPGCSWVEINNQVHVFVSDGVHPSILEIHSKLEELDRKLRSVGYVPQIEHVLHKVHDEEKRDYLIHHSEKLALAFALLSTTPKKQIRIFKNLRICGDCHNYMKLVSDITDREIVVRDVKRFHHFKGGYCSCQDYW